MHQPELAGKSLRHERWDQRVGAFSRLPALIRQLGADPRAMLSRAVSVPKRSRVRKAEFRITRW